MANPITWRNVDGLDTSGVSNLMSLANQTMNKGFDTATSTVKDAITQRASDLKVSRDATLNTALANLNKLSTAEFNDNNIVGSIAVDAGISDPASRRAYEEQVNTLRNARRKEDEAIAKEEQEKKLRPIAVKQAEVNVDYTGSQIKQNNASANNLNASAASTQQQTSARVWEQGQKESQLNFEQNNAGVRGQLSNANPEYFTQDNLDSLIKGMSPADARFLVNNWPAFRDASITRGGSQSTAQTALLKAQEQLGNTKDIQAGRAVVDDSFRSGASYEGTASVVALMPNGPAKNAAFSRLNEIQAGNQVGSSDNSKLVQIGNQSNWESQGKALADEGLAPDEVAARVKQLFPNNAIAVAAVMNSYTAARQGVSDATTGLTNQGSKESIAAAQEAVRKLENDSATPVTAAAIAANSNPTAAINDLVKDAPSNQQAELRAFWEKKVADQATNMAKQFVESNADTIMQDMRDPAKNPYEVLNSSLNEIKNPAVRAQVRNTLIEQMKASDDNGVVIAAVVADTDKEVESALVSKAQRYKSDITNLAAKKLNGTVTDEEVKTAISVLSAGDPALHERLTTEFNKVSGQFNTLSTQDRQKLERDIAAINLNYKSAVEAASAEAGYIKNSNPVDAKSAPIAAANQVQQNMANKLKEVKGTKGEYGFNFATSRISEKINETFNNADFKKELSNNLSSFSKQVRDAVDSGRISEDTGKRILDTLNNDPAVKNAIHNIIINTVIQPGADGVIEFTTPGHKPGGNIRQVENALPAAVEAVGSNVLNNEIQREADANLLRELGALQAKNDENIEKLQKSSQGKPQVTPK